MLMNKNLANYYMEKYNLDALVATQPISIKYFCGFDCWFTNWLKDWMTKPGGSNCSIPLFCILAYKNDPILIIPTVIASFALNTFSKETRFYGSIPPIPRIMNSHMIKDNVNEFDRKQLKIFESIIYRDASEALSDTIKEKGLNDSNIGFELKSFNKSIFSEILKKLKKCLFKDCTELIRLIRMIKTEEEISLLSKSAELNELALQESARLINENNTFKKAFNKFKDITEKRGAIVEHFIFSSYGCGVSDNKNYQFKKDQFIILDTGVYYLNYISDTGTTIFTGKPERKNIEIFKIIYECINIGLNNIKPGEKCSKINDSMIKYLEKHNIYNTDTHGHGIGLEASEYPIIKSNALNYTYNDGFEKRNADFILEENMVVTLEIPYYVYSIGSYIIEVSVIVTKNDYKKLSNQNRNKPIINL